MGFLVRRPEAVVDHKADRVALSLAGKLARAVPLSEEQLSPHSFLLLILRFNGPTYRFLEENNLNWRAEES